MNGYSYHDGSYNAGIMDTGDQGGNNDMMMMGQDSMVGGQSLDEIVSQNAKAMRRESMTQPYGDSVNAVAPDIRRVSMMDYGAASPISPMGNFQFEPNTGIEQGGISSGDGSPAQTQHQTSHNRRHSHGDLALNTTFANNAAGYNNMMSSISAYQSPNPQSGFDMAMNSPYIDPGMGMQMDYNSDQRMAGTTGADVSQMNSYNQSGFNNSQGRSARHPLKSRSLHIPSMSSPMHSGGVKPISPLASNQAQNPANMGFQGQPQHPQPGSRQDRGMGDSSDMYDGINGPLPLNLANYNPNNQGFKWETPEGGWPSTMVGRPHMQTQHKNAYSSTGFDMLGVLMRVAARPNPEINIGAVDLSCAFVVCDAEKDDIPIVYCSDNFERLTGYTKHMILGRNCRFLQSPDGNVEPGLRRKYVDDDSVLYLKNIVNLRREGQISLINYRRGGQPFMNLLTMIPIAWDTEQVKFFVGFQVDLVEQPNSVTNKNPDGSYSINYQRPMAMPRYVLNAPDASQKTDLGQTIARDEVSAILSSIGNGESEYAKRMWDKVLLENTDDVVHVLSLKGLFQWVSPSAARVLEYEPSEIIGTALSTVCHPSDIVPVTRELKDTSTGASVNVVFRIRRKNSGYMWFEGHGSLHTEQGKGRKSIILAGRERPVYTLSKTDIQNNGGIGENELWTKMSTSGMFLFVSSNVRQLLDRQPDDLVGVSIQTLMRMESRTEFGRILEHARTGKKASIKHEMINRRGQVLSAYSTLYPGDATEGLKPTFIVAQTRFIKFPRNTPANRPAIQAKDEGDATEQTPQLVGSQTVASGETTPMSGVSAKYLTTGGSAATYAGQNGLVIGHQDDTLASEDNLVEELKTTKSSSWQYEIRQLEKKNRVLAEEVQSLIAAKKKRKRRRGKDSQKDCANCHTRVTPEWRRGPSGQRDLCNSCGLRWAKHNGRVSPRTSSQQSAHSAGASDKASKASLSPRLSSAQPVAIKKESPSQPQPRLSTSVTPGTESSVPRESPTTTKPQHEDGHAANMEGASGVPDKIDEGVEEPD